ncbi:electron transport complex subunit RsxG [Sulfurivermis fontis]|uniref:electron transport complex subunit RsxG n=1 Tax=Sulfurivermis fontis TaxID=1972068 RepID=UPI001E3474F5|nr:electron transport complex subunit RsxG [Sulfurivermis fontis]
MPLKKMLLSASLLGLFAVLGTALVTFTYESTHERIAQNERNVLLRSLHALIPPERHDNDLVSDSIAVTDAALLGSPLPQQVYRARQGGAPVALALTAVAPDGYSGDINLLIAINHDGSLAGVRVTAHRETPGLGDKVDVARTDWVHAFAGRSLSNPPPEKWKVKKDGGVFDQFTGATVTPRAVVKAVRNALDYYQQHRDTLFDGGSDAAQEVPHG